jgi:hypothetical protein
MPYTFTISALFVLLTLASCALLAYDPSISFHQPPSVRAFATYSSVIMHITLSIMEAPIESRGIEGSLRISPPSGKPCAFE